ANGLAWSLDNRTMFVADRPNEQILAFDYDLKSGKASNRRTFCKVPNEDIPDGAAVDADGGYWVAMYGASCVRRYRPSGQLDREVRTPANPTMIAFHPERDEAYLTTSNYNVVKNSAMDTGSGGIFIANLGVKGVPEPVFKL